ncbi:MAG: monovalent cation/H+ antiporter complex subunit F [Candidatus Binatia bacterium]|nr:monovalent cation/H+ antiporter complex subunit F [Candidatus Binatia bacterium]
MIPAVCVWVILPLLSVAVLLTVVRLALGPSFPDRVVALDLLTTIGVGIVTAAALAWQQAALFDVATVLALVSFLATVAFARYVERGIRLWSSNGQA